MNFKVSQLKSLTAGEVAVDDLIYVIDSNPTDGSVKSKKVTVGDLIDSRIYGISSSQFVLITGYYADPSWITSLDWSKITNAPSFVTSLSALTDVQLSTPLVGQALVYNGTKWVNQGIGELDTLNSVTTRGNTTTNNITVGTLYFGNASHYLVTDNSTYAMLSSNRTLQLSTSGNPVLSVFTTQNVAIGTTTDAGYKLDVNGTARVQGVLTGTANINGLTVSNNNSNPVIGSDGTNVLIGSNQAYRIVFTNNRIDFKVSDGTNAINAGSFTSSGSLYVGGNAATTAKLQVTGSITAASLLAQGVYFNNTLVAAANNDVLVGLDINPTFTNGAFTGLQNYALRLTNSPAFFGGDPIAMFITNNASIRGNATTGGILYIDGSRDLTGTIRLRATTVDIPGAASIGTITATAITVSSTNAVSLVTGTGVTSFRIGNTTSSSIWYFENNRNAPAGSLEITNSISSPGMTFFSSRNVAINSNTDAGYKLDVNGTARIAQSTAGTKLTVTGIDQEDVLVVNWGGTNSIGLGSNTANNPVLRLGVIRFTAHPNGGRLQLSGATGRFGTDTELKLYGSVSGTATGTMVWLGSNSDFSAAAHNPTSGTLNVVGVLQKAGPLYAAFNPASGNATFNIFNIDPVINTSGTYAGIVRGFYYNPTLTSITGVTHRAIETTAGDVIFNGGNVGIGTTTPVSKLNVYGGDIISSSSTANRTTKLNDTGLYLSRTSDGVYTSSITADGAMFFNTRNSYVFNNDGTATITFQSDTRNVLIGASVADLARLTVKGSGSTSATKSLLVQNSAGTVAIEIYDDRTLRQWGQAFFHSSNTISFASDRISMQPYTGFGIRYRGVNVFELYATETNDMIGLQIDRGLSIYDAGAPVLLDNSAKLQINSTNRGFLAPRMTTAQILLITSPAEGLQVYNTDLHVICFYDGTGWKKVSHSNM